MVAVFDDEFEGAHGASVGGAGEGTGVEFFLDDGSEAEFIGFLDEVIEVSGALGPFDEGFAGDAGGGEGGAFGMAVEEGDEVDALAREVSGEDDAFVGFLRDGRVLAGRDGVREGLERGERDGVGVEGAAGGVLVIALGVVGAVVASGRRVEGDEVCHEGKVADWDSGEPGAFWRRVASPES